MSTRRLQGRSLLDQILAPPQLRLAWQRVRANRGMAGHDGITLHLFEQDLDARLRQLADEVRTGRYRPAPLLRVEIRTKQKSRSLAIPAVRDRVLQRATLDVIAPLAEHLFVPNSFGYRVGCGVAQAVERVVALHRQGFIWVVDADIDDCFGALDHAMLRQRIHAVVPDPHVCRLLNTWIIGYAGERGVPLGSVVSPFFCNLYLHPLDIGLAKRGFVVVRYADDFIVLSRTPAQAGKALIAADEVVSALLLRLNRRKTRIVSFDAGFSFLGFSFLSGRPPIAIDGERRLPGSEPW